MKKNYTKAIIAFLAIAFLAAGSLTIYNYSRYSSTKKSYTIAKVKFNKDKKENDKALKKLNEVTKNSQNKSNQIDSKIKTYLANKEDANAIVPKLVSKLEEMTPPEGRVFRAANESLKSSLLAHKPPQSINQAKEEWPDLWAEAEKVAELLAYDSKRADENWLYERVKTLTEVGRPFKNNNWPEIYSSPDGMRTITIGTPMYDDVGTNFSGMNPDGKYADAKDNKVKKSNETGTSKEPGSLDISSDGTEVSKEAGDLAEEFINSVWPGNENIPAPHTRLMVIFGQNIMKCGRPYLDGEWPDEVTGPGQTVSKGSQIYDSVMRTNFSGKNPNGQFSEAK